jgi:hypothetical protein
MTKERELLRRALEALVEEAQYHNDIMLRWHDVFLDIRTFLAAEEERKPKFIRKKVCWNCGWPIQKTRPEPAIRKPMAEEEIEDIYYSGLTFENTYLAAFVEGFRQAERKHEIGEDDE